MSTPFRPRNHLDENVWRARAFHTDASALADIFSDKQIDLDDWATAIARSEATGFPVKHGGAAWTPEMRILSALFSVLRPKVAVEVGIARGESLRAEREFHVPEVHVAYDVNPSFVGNAPKGVMAGVHDGTGPIALPAPFDLAFLDDGHSGGWTRRWLDTLNDASGPDSVIVVHDMRVESTGGDDRMCVVDFLRAHPEWAGYELRTPCGMAFLRRTT